MHILLLGGTGQIGYALAQALSETSHQTSILVRDRRKLAFPENARILQAPSFSADTFEQALCDIDCAIYAVGLREQFAADAGIFELVNCGILQTFLDALQQSTVRRLIYVSTYEVFQAIDGIIRESHPVAEPGGMTPYGCTMIQAYKLLTERAQNMNLALTTIHPAAVYGGLNTGEGFNNYLENLLNWRVSRTPVIVEGRFPLVHARSLARAIVRSIGHSGAYIVREQMASLEDMARALRRHANSYVPPVVPLWAAQAGASILETAARKSGRRPAAARVQVEFVTKGWDPKPDRAREELSWHPCSLSQGIQRYLEDRERLLAAAWDRN